MRRLLGIAALMLGAGLLAGTVRSERNAADRERTAAAVSGVVAPQAAPANPPAAQPRLAVWRPYTGQPRRQYWTQPSPRYGQRNAYRGNGTYREYGWRPSPTWREPYTYGGRTLRPRHGTGYRRDGDGWQPNWRYDARPRPRLEAHRWVGTPADSYRYR